MFTAIVGSVNSLPCDSLCSRILAASQGLSLLCIIGGHGWSQAALGAQAPVPVRAHLRACLGAREHLGGSVRGVEGSADTETGGPARPQGRGEAVRGGEGRLAALPGPGRPLAPAGRLRQSAHDAGSGRLRGAGRR